MPSIDSLQTRKDLKVGSKAYQYYSLAAAEEAGLKDVSRLPVSMKVLLENLLRNEDGDSVSRADLEAIAAWLDNKGRVEHEISFRPARVLMQDFTGVPAVVDLAAMRDAMKNLGGDPEKINPLVPVDLVIDHSVIVDEFGSPKALKHNVALEYARKLFAALEKYVYDPVYKGYYESCNRDWKVNPWIHGVNRVPSDEKTMNTHLHLIEAYTCFLRVEDTPVVRNKVREHLYVMLNKIVNHDIHHYHYFQGRDWKPNSTAISFGHDIEGSWLMMETCEVLGEPEAHRAARDTCVNMARACYEEGFREDGAMLTEFDPANGEWARHLSWWEQNEAVVGFLNAWEQTSDEKYLDASLKCFEYAEEHFVDRKLGGWHPILELDGTFIPQVLKCDGPICPYHNGRMSMEIIERYRHHQGK